MLGRSVDGDAVGGATGCPPQEAIGRLRQAARAQLIDTDGAGFRFRHALTAEAVRSSLLPEERQLICASLLETLQLLHPGLEGETCQLAASPAVQVRDQLRAADLLLGAAGPAVQGAAAEFGRAALADAGNDGLAEVTCRALWVIGRAERGSGTEVARAAFEEAYECASRNALPVFRVKSLQELGTIDMFETLGTARLEEARREALAAGAISMVAMVGLQLAATYSARGQAGLTLAAAAPRRGGPHPVGP